mmetsp:Transcript_5783/g.35920  ORF Transcript_5783/g.35920 Transcript_5783/m.35920 type:complete len:202 (-) Transcript_5783:43-648(-)
MKVEHLPPAHVWIFVWRNGRHGHGVVFPSVAHFQQHWRREEWFGCFRGFEDDFHRPAAFGSHHQRSSARQDWRIWFGTQRERSPGSDVGAYDVGALDLMVEFEFSQPGKAPPSVSQPVSVVHRQVAGVPAGFFVHRPLERSSCSHQHCADTSHVPPPRSHRSRLLRSTSMRSLRHLSRASSWLWIRTNDEVRIQGNGHSNA